MEESKGVEPHDISESAGAGSRKTGAVINTQEHPNFGRGRHRVHGQAVNHEFRRKLWDGQLPIKVNLHYKEISTNKRVRSLYMMVPRLNYFTFILEKVKASFDEYVPSDSIDAFDAMWFSYEGRPLKWDVPIGVQFDTLIGFGGGADGRDKASELPWQLVFHYKGCPDDQIVKLTKNGGLIGIKYIEFSFINSLKESHVLRMGSANEILAQMKKYEEEKLLDGVQKHNYELFWEINQPLCDKHIADMKKYAIRIFSNMYANFVQPGYDIQMDESNNFDKWEQDNYNITIGDFLLKSFPNLFIAEPKDPGSGTTSIQQRKHFDILCHGLKIDLKTPLYWLQLNMSYLDNFVYLSFHSY